MFRNGTRKGRGIAVLVVAGFEKVELTVPAQALQMAASRRRASAS